MAPKRFLALAALIPAVLLGACTLGPQTVGSSLVGSPAATPGSVNATEAAALITNYRASRGLPAVSVDRRLMHIAADHAGRMAASRRMAHVLPGEGSFQRRLAAGGFDASLAAENIGAGYDSLAEAMNGWRNSPDHDKNLLLPGVSRIGIAVVLAADGKYRTYWSLVLAEPYVPPSGGGGPTAGPPTAVLGR
jgi:uncharacterized protein YkwD